MAPLDHILTVVIPVITGITTALTGINAALTIGSRIRQWWRGRRGQR